MGLITAIKNRDNKKALKQLEKIASKIEDLSEVYKNKTDEELKQTTDILKQRLNDGETLDDILPDAYALVREASDRVLNMRHFHVQLIGGIVLHQGRIAEMRTGEGKTLVATLPAYLNALTGKGVHVVTVNDYLAKVQGEQMSKLFNFLGLTVGILISGHSEAVKRLVYSCDIVYGTNHEFGFDYLRDNMVVTKQQKMQRGFNFAIVDEIDSILIDEARTPLVISGKGMKSSDRYLMADKFAKSLKEDDYTIDEKQKIIIMTESGIDKAERFFNIENISDVENIELNHHINNALRANYIMKKDINYIVNEEEGILIIDEFTGRALAGRRYSDGLHQAIEAKEGVKINDENKTLATITFQNFFRLYKKLSGMTGTAKSEELEFNKIYNLDVVEIPTNKPAIRKDANDIIYKTRNGKFRAIVEAVKEMHETGRPILIGTVSIEDSEELSKLLKQAGIKHNVLNARNHALEADIVAQAGRFNSVTIATNMAGRGTDILLGGNPDYLAKQKLRQEGVEETDINLATSYRNDKPDNIKKIEEKYNEYYNKFKAITDEEKEKVVELGGLHIIGSERHESRRIDNQLRGRAGRQGDPGSTIFYISMEDDLVRIFGGDKMLRVAEMLKIDEDTPFQLKVLSSGVEKAQKRIEMRNYSSRKAVLLYDDVMNMQRANIYAQRDEILDGIDMREQIIDMFTKTLTGIVFSELDDDKTYYEWKLDTLNLRLEDNIFAKGTNLVTEEFVENCTVQEVADKVVDYAVQLYDKKREDAKELGFDYSILERVVVLKVVDTLWMDHIDSMAMLRNEIFVKQYGQQDPIAAYKRTGSEMFDIMIEKVWRDVTTFILNIRLEKAPQMQQQEQGKPKIREAAPKRVGEVDETGKNKPCPCGSGMKYKNCCGKKNKK
ncbi:MAG: preprotein translocase subunit SecA [Clostridia bacterium]|nr:preprotein translocase subunit SecA [Clostridia bacterium]